MSNIAMQGGSTGTGTVTLLAPSTSTNRTLTLPDSTGTVALQGGTGVGKVLQVVNATYATQVTNNTNVHVDTGLTATITPISASSKILVLVNQAGCGKENGNAASNIIVKLLRGATDILLFDNISAFTLTDVRNYIGSISCCYLDSPATTSATTYKTQFRNSQNTAGVGVNGNSSASTITLMEIGA